MVGLFKSKGQTIFRAASFHEVCMGTSNPLGVTGIIMGSVGGCPNEKVARSKQKAEGLKLSKDFTFLAAFIASREHAESARGLGT